MQNCESNPEEKGHRWRHNPPRLQIILQSYSNQNSIGTKTDIWIKRIESPEINPHIDCQLIFNKGGEDIEWRKDSLFGK